MTQSTFATLGLSEEILRAVAAQNYTTPTPIQAGAIPALLAGQDLLGIAQTGTGKTAAFALPILQMLAASPSRPKPPATGQYNPLQKLAYSSTIGFGVLSLLTGIVLYKPAQFAWLAFLFGGFHLTRLWHFAAMCGFLSFIPGHLIMVVLHGWSNFMSMLSGWKREPEYQE